MKVIIKRLIIVCLCFGIVFGANETVKAEGYNAPNMDISNISDEDGSTQKVSSVAEEGIDFSELSNNLHTTALSEKSVCLSWPKVSKAAAYRVYVKEANNEFTFYAETNLPSCEIAVKKNSNYTFRVSCLELTDTELLEYGDAQIDFSNRSIVELDHQKYTYKEMSDDIVALANKYYDYVSYESIGKTKKGRIIYDVILGNKDAKKSLLVVCSLHAREYVTSAIVMKQLEYYLENYNNIVDGVRVSDVFSECNIHYVMMANPDGVTISQTQNARWKANANGVNLNNNFPVYFEKKGSKKKGTFTGKKAASENETKAIIAITQKLMSQDSFAVVNYHAMGNIVFGDTYKCSDSLKSTIQEMYSTARNTTGYGSAYGYRSSSHGNYREYLMYKLNVPAITIEVGSESCPVPAYCYKSIFEKNRLVILREAQIL